VLINVYIQSLVIAFGLVRWSPYSFGFLSSRRLFSPERRHYLFSDSASHKPTTLL